MPPIAFVASLVCIAGASPALGVAQTPSEPQPATAVFIQADRLITRPGEVIEHGNVVVKNGKIVAIGVGLTAPEGARVIQGKVVCAGFIDPWASFGLDEEAVHDERAGAATQSADAWDPYLDRRFRSEVLRAGVTSMRVQAGAAAKVAGLGAFVRNHTQIVDQRVVLLRDSCLSMNVGVTRGGRGLDLFDRVADVERALGAFGDGLSYLQDKIEYKHDLETWQKTITDKQKELDDGFKKAKKDREKDEADAKKNGKEFKEKSYKEDKRPKAPRFDADKEVLARAANGEIPVVVEVHRSIELRSLLEGSEKYDRLRLILAGATDALSCVDQIKARRIPVMVAPQPLGKARALEQRRSDPALAAQLVAGGATILIGSGGDDELASRDLPLMAEIAIGYGLDRDVAFEALTLGAARAFDLADRIGSIEVGKDADLQVLDGEPLISTSRVQYVLSAGDVVITPEE